MCMHILHSQSLGSQVDAFKQGALAPQEPQPACDVQLRLCSRYKGSGSECHACIQAANGGAAAAKSCKSQVVNNPEKAKGEITLNM